MSLLENYRGQVREGGMAAARVVPAFDEVEDGQARVGVSREAVPIEQLALEGREEALAEGVVVGVADASHRRPDAGVATPPAEGERGVDRKSTRLNSSHVRISYAVFCLKKKKHPTDYNRAAAQ